MNPICSQNSQRRQFIKQCAAAASALTLAPTFAWSASSSGKSEFHVALLSDPHIPEDPSDGWNGFLPIDNMNLVTPNVIKAKPAAAIINGDAARLVGTVADYKILKELIQPMAAAMPIFINMGNHDDRNNFYKVFPEALTQKEHQDIPNKHVTVLESPQVRILILDSLFHVNDGAGFLGKRQRNWLSKNIDSSEKPTVLVVHHTLGDGDGDLIDSDRLFGMIKTRPQVKAIFYGHSHNYHITKHDDIHLINLPAIGYNFSKQQPIGWIDAFFRNDGVRFTLDAVAGNKKDHGKEVDLKWMR